MNCVDLKELIQLNWKSHTPYGCDRNSWGRTTKIKSAGPACNYLYPPYLRIYVLKSQCGVIIKMLGGIKETQVQFPWDFGVY